MSNINETYKQNEIGLKGKKLKKKQVYFGFVETNYYERMPGIVTTKEDVQIISSYKSFATIKENFKQKLTDDSFENKINWFEQTEDKQVNSNKSQEEIMNEFYSISGVTAKRCSDLSLNVKERLRLLLESEVGRKEIEKVIEEQSELTKSRRISEEKIKAIEYRKKEIKLLQDECNAATAEEKEELEEEIAETNAYFDKQEKQDLERLSVLLEDDKKKLLARYNRLMTDILSEIHQKENDQSIAFTINNKNIYLSEETEVKKKFDEVPELA